MSYTSYGYLLLFLGGTLLFYYLMPLSKRWMVLLAASYAFYYLASGWLLIFLLITTATVYLGALALEREQRAFNAVRKTLDKDARKKRKGVMMVRKRRIVALMLLVNVGLLAFLKYYAFFSGNINGLMGRLGTDWQLPSLKLIMPLGISFYTLSAVGYIIDVYRGQSPADHHFGRLALFLSLFTNITEGPISRYGQLAGQAFEGHRLNYERVTGGAQLILWGLFQKMVLADRAAILVSTVFGEPQAYGGKTVVLAVLIYTLQIYADFAGCINIVRGSAQLFGIELAVNFRQPFFSKSVGEFWRRWHMTLGAWFKDYIFYPVTLSKVNMKMGRWAKAHLNPHLGQLLPTAFALFFVWLANGIWHGAAWKYVVYGMYYYGLTLLGLIFKPWITGFYEKGFVRRESVGWQLFRMGRTFILVNIGMLIFRANTLSDCRQMLLSVVGPDRGNVMALGLDAYDLALLAVGTVVMLFVSILKEKGWHLRERIAAQPLPLRWGIYLAAICAVIVFGAYGRGYGVVDPVYANF